MLVHNKTETQQCSFQYGNTAQKPSPGKQTNPKIGSGASEPDKRPKGWSRSTCFLPAFHVKAPPVGHQNLLFFLLDASFQGSVVAGIGRVTDDCGVPENRQIGGMEN